MKSQRIYIDTSVIGGYFDPEFEKDTKYFFESLINSRNTIVISDLTEKELQYAPEKVRYLLKTLDIKFIEVLKTNEEVLLLSDSYIIEKVVGKTSKDDCTHIALATINKVDILVSWNFKHIVNINRIRNYNSVNLKNGYSTVEIRSPKEVIDYEDN